MATTSDYTGYDIPVRLWRWGREARNVESDDWLYMRHEPLVPPDSPYVGQIPGHRHLEDQSVNSHCLNRRGAPRDVLFDTARGAHHWHYQIARLRVREIEEHPFPNEFLVKRHKDGRREMQTDVFTFRVKHTPDDRMFPHCIIEAKKNGSSPVKIESKSLRTSIRYYFAELAERHREEMNAHYQPGSPVRRSLLDVIIGRSCSILGWIARKLNDIRRSGSSPCC